MAEFEYNVAAQLLCMSEQEFIDFLYKENIITITKLPYQQYVKAGLFCKTNDRATITTSGVNWIKKHINALQEEEAKKQRLKEQRDQKKLAKEQKTVQALKDSEESELLE